MIHLASDRPSRGQEIRKIFFWRDPNRIPPPADVRFVSSGTRYRPKSGLCAKKKGVLTRQIRFGILDDQGQGNRPGDSSSETPRANNV
jgi:hypothetical protein